MTELTELPIQEVARFIGLLESSLVSLMSSLNHCIIDTLRWTKLWP